MKSLKSVTLYNSDEREMDIYILLTGTRLSSHPIPMVAFVSIGRLQPAVV